MNSKKAKHSRISINTSPRFCFHIKQLRAQVCDVLHFIPHGGSKKKFAIKPLATSHPAILFQSQSKSKAGFAIEPLNDDKTRRRARVPPQSSMMMWHVPFNPQTKEKAARWSICARLGRNVWCTRLSLRCEFESLSDDDETHLMDLSRRLHARAQGFEPLLR